MIHLLTTKYGKLVGRGGGGDRHLVIAPHLWMSLKRSLSQLGSSQTSLLSRQLHSSRWSPQPEAMTMYIKHKEEHEQLNDTNQQLNDTNQQRETAASNKIQVCDH